MSAEMNAEFEFFSRSTPKLISGAAAQQLDELLNKPGNLPIQGGAWSENFTGVYADYIEPNLFFFIAMFLLGLFLYYKYITKQDKEHAEFFDSDKKTKKKENLKLIDAALYNDILQNDANNAKSVHTTNTQEILNETNLQEHSEWQEIRNGEIGSGHIDLTNVMNENDKIHDIDRINRTHIDDYNSIYEHVDIYDTEPQYRTNNLNEIWYGDQYNRSEVVNDMYKTLFGDR